MALKMEGVDPQQIRQLLERKRKEDLRGLLKAQQKGKLTEYLMDDLKELQRQNMETRGAGAPAAPAATSAPTPPPAPAPAAAATPGTSAEEAPAPKRGSSKRKKKTGADRQKVIQRLIAKKKKEDLEGLMKAWGEGKLQEYLAPDLAKLDAEEAEKEAAAQQQADGADEAAAAAEAQRRASQEAEQARERAQKAMDEAEKRRLQQEQEEEEEAKSRASIGSARNSLSERGSIGGSGMKKRWTPPTANVPDGKEYVGSVLRRSSNSSIGKGGEAGSARRGSAIKSASEIEVGTKIIFLLQGNETKGVVVKKLWPRIRVEYNGGELAWAESRNVFLDNSPDDEAADDGAGAGAGSAVGGSAVNRASTTANYGSTLAPAAGSTLSGFSNGGGAADVSGDVDSINAFVKTYKLEIWLNDLNDLAGDIDDLKEMEDADIDDFVDETGMPDSDAKRLREALAAIGAKVTADGGGPGGKTVARRPSNVSESWLHRTVTKILVPTGDQQMSMEHWIDQQRDATGQQWLVKYKADLMDIADGLEDIKEMNDEDLQDLIDQCGMGMNDSRRLRRACKALGANVNVEGDESDRNLGGGGGGAAAAPAAPAAPSGPSETEKLEKWVTDLGFAAHMSAIKGVAGSVSELAEMTDDDFDELVQEAKMKWSQAGKLREALVALGAKLT